MRATPVADIITVADIVAVAACLAAAVAIVACGPPPFVVHVTYPGEVDVEPGSAVVYEGVKVGHVVEVSLRQDVAARPALVEVTAAITDRSLVLREDDRFHLASHRGLAVIEISPVPEASLPIPNGGTVAGVPPLVSRVEESLGAAADSIGALVVEALEATLDAVNQELDERVEITAETSPPLTEPRESGVPTPQTGGR